MMIFKQFGEELPHLLLRRCQSLLARASRAVRSSTAAAIALLVRAQHAGHFQPMQHGINRPSAQPVAVSSELFDHAQAKDRLLAGMVQNVPPNQTRVEVLAAVFLDIEMTRHRFDPLCR